MNVECKGAVLLTAIILISAHSFIMWGYVILEPRAWWWWLARCHLLHARLCSGGGVAVSALTDPPPHPASTPHIVSSRWIILTSAAPHLISLAIISPPHPASTLHIVSSRWIILNSAAPHLTSLAIISPPHPASTLHIVSSHQCCTSTDLLLHLTSLSSIYAYHLNYLLSYLHLTQPRPHTLSLVVRLYSPPPPPHFTC